MKKVILTFFLSIVFIFSFFITSDIAYAATCGTTEGDLIGLDCVEQGSGLEKTDPRIVVVRVLNTILSLLGIVVTIIILYAGFMWMTAGGNDEKVGKARKILMSAVVGLAIILSSWAITSFFLKNLYQATTGQPLGGYNTADDFKKL